MVDKIDYQQFIIRPSLRWWFNNKTLFYLQKLIYKFPFVGKPFRYIGYRLFFIGKLGEQEQKRLASISLLNNPAQNAQDFGSNYGYNDAVRELSYTALYHNQLREKDFEEQPSESSALYKQAIQVLSKLFDRDKNITHLVNFGVCYAHIDSVLSRKYRQVNFIGVDRSNFTKLYNEEYFADSQNLEFINGDILDLLTQRKFGGLCLLHTRTACYLPKTFMERLYKTAYDSGCRYIIGLEQIGISRQTFKPFEFDESDRPSVLFRDGFFIHNYPGLVSKAGFKIESIELVKTKHPHEDYRILSFVAQRGG